MFKVAMIGETSLLVSCAECVLENKTHYEISVVCTSNPEIIAWCKSHNIFCFIDIKEFEDYLCRINIDYLFSIVNYHYLPITILRSVKQLAINYHDALLPYYAGVNATSWAIFNNEIMHGISWHVMTTKFDAGDIIEQIPISIDKAETAFSLNIKCYEAALLGLKTLLAKLLKHEVTFTKQDRKNRSYYGYMNQLPRFGIIDWNDTAENIIHTMRCCTFGKYQNRFGLVKCLIGNTIYYVEQVEEVKTEITSSQPGTIIFLEKGEYAVKTRSNLLKLLRLIDEQGNHHRFQELCEEHKLNFGSCLPVVSKAQYIRCETQASAIALYESYWFRQFVETEPLSLPSDLVRQSEKRYSVTFPLSSLGLDKKEDLIALIFIYIYRIGNWGTSNTFVGLTHQYVVKAPFKILAEYLPLCLSLIGKEKFYELVDRIRLILKKNSTKKTFTRDLFIRHPEFQYVEIGSRLFPPIIIHQGEVSSIQWEATTQLAIVLSQDQRQCTFVAKLPKLELTRIIERLQHMAKCIQQEKPIAHYQLLTETEYQCIIFDWNNTATPYPHDKTIFELFEEQVERTPNNTAIIYEDRRLTYIELNEKTNQLADYLRNKFAIKPDDLITLCMDRSEHLLIAILAVLKTGGAYVPIDPNYPLARINFILADTQSKILLINQRYFKILREGLTIQAVNILALDDELFIQQLAQQQKTNISCVAKSNNLAYVIYTSGTTGKPKGVMIEHRSVVNRIKWMNDQYPLNVTDRILQKTPYTFDVSVWELFWANWYGASIVFVKPEKHKDLNYLIELIERECITIIHFVPSLLNIFIEVLRKKLLHLRHIFCSGEPLTTAQVKMCQTALPMTKIHNLYGPTEASIDVLFYDCEKDIRTMYIGKPINNIVCYVLDNHLMPLPVGTIGELYVGGDGVARGYLNNPDLTAICFIDNPFQSKEERQRNKNTKLYKTGDLVRWHANGYIEYIGRGDLQVKIKGNRIELGEIETMFSIYPGIQQCVVLVKKRPNLSFSFVSSEFLVGYYLAEEKIDENKLFQYLQDNLPEYMVPTFLVKLDKFPITSNGKTDRKILAEINLPNVNEEPYVAPKTNLENIICGIWAEVLSLPFNELGMKADFFRLGGDSILAIRLVGILNTKFNWNLKIQDIYNTKCVSELIKFISSNVIVNDKSKLIYRAFSLFNIENHVKKLRNFDSIEDIYPASYLQSGMLIEANLDNKGTYHDVFIYSIDASYDEKKFLTIWRKLIDKNELLRAAFSLYSEGFYVVIYKEITMDFRLYERQNAKLLIDKERLNKFDYSNPGLFRLLINRDKVSHFELIFSFHHAIADGWSVASLLQDFIQAYVNESPILPNEGLQYGEFVQAELRALQDNALIRFWGEYLHKASISKVQWQRNNNLSANSLYCLSFNLSDGQVNLVHALVKKLGISADILFLFAYFKTLSYYLNSSEVTIGLVVNNRLEKAGGDQMFGLFLNTIPCKFKLADDKKISLQLFELFNEKIKLQQFKKIPFGYIKKRFKQSTYDFAFNFIHFHVLNNNLENFESFVGYERTSIPFTLNIFQRWHTNFCVKMSVHDDFASEYFLNNLLEYYISTLNNILIHADQLFLLKQRELLHADINVLDNSLGKKIEKI